MVNGILRNSVCWCSNELTQQAAFTINMAAAAAAALLDELMGRNRNVLPNEKPKELNWEDPEVFASLTH